MSIRLDGSGAGMTLYVVTVSRLAMAMNGTIIRPLPLPLPLPDSLTVTGSQAQAQAQGQASTSHDPSTPSVHDHHHHDTIIPIGPQHPIMIMAVVTGGESRIESEAESNSTTKLLLTCHADDDVDEDGASDSVRE